MRLRSLLLAGVGAVALAATADASIIASIDTVAPGAVAGAPFSYCGLGGQALRLAPER
jgi:hypothetical protein